MSSTRFQFQTPPGRPFPPLFRRSPSRHFSTSPKDEDLASENLNIIRMRDEFSKLLSGVREQNKQLNEMFLSGLEQAKPKHQKEMEALEQRISEFEASLANKGLRYEEIRVEMMNKKRMKASLTDQEKEVEHLEQEIKRLRKMEHGMGDLKFLTTEEGSAAGKLFNDKRLGDLTPEDLLSFVLNPTKREEALNTFEETEEELKKQISLIKSLGDGVLTPEIKELMDKMEMTPQFQLDLLAKISSAPNSPTLSPPDISVEGVERMNVKEMARYFSSRTKEDQQKELKEAREAHESIKKLEEMKRLSEKMQDKRREERVAKGVPDALLKNDRSYQEAREVELGEIKAPSDMPGHNHLLGKLKDLRSHPGMRQEVDHLLAEFEGVHDAQSYDEIKAKKSLQKVIKTLEEFEQEGVPEAIQKISKNKVFQQMKNTAEISLEILPLLKEENPKQIYSKEDVERIKKFTGENPESLQFLSEQNFWRELEKTLENIPKQ